MIKLIVSDLDGTLLDHSRRISASDWTAVKQAFQEGYEFCIASGRMHSEIKILMEEFHGRYYTVSQNGATIYKKDKELVANYFFEPEVSSQILQFSSRHNHFVNFIHCTDDSFYLEKRTDATIPYESRILTSCSVRGDLVSALENGEIKSCKYSFFGDLDKLMLLNAELQNQFAGKIESFISERDCLDVMPLNVNKGVGLTFIMQELGLSPNEVACIGDSFNDVSMFALTNHSFAMRGSHADVKKKATNVINSVAEAIEQIVSYNRSLEVR
ncbi:haloacid dehalogenase [Paenibacillus sp. URB8-2]|nr:haloacid dehalogenase [Paenibacillus sp. URB8-2]